MPSPIIGLTGPTGAGKSEASRVLRAMGGVIVDADAAARAAVQCPDCLAALQSAFGADICTDGVLNRHELARRAFADAASTRQLNAITHPHILAQMRAQIRAAQAENAPFVVLDAPLLLESGLDAACDAVFVVLADPALRLRRICARDGITEADARQRMAAQHPDAYYIARAAEVFRNDGDLTALESAIRAAAAAVCGA